MTKTNDVAEAIIMERILDAPVQKVWKALTDVNQMREWYFDLKQFKPEIGFISWSSTRAILIITFAKSRE